MKFIKSVLAALFALLSSIGVVMAQEATGPDLSSLTSVVSFGTVTAAVLGIYASMVGFRLAWKSGEKVLQALRKL